jgi:iron complex outermembrane recepter protein
MAVDMGTPYRLVYHRACFLWSGVSLREELKPLRFTAEKMGESMSIARTSQRFLNAQTVKRLSFRVVLTLVAVTAAAGLSDSTAAGAEAANVAEVSQAQETAAEKSGGDALAEVVVTASRREETVQKSALAIVAITGDQARQAGLVQVTDLSNLVLGLQISTNGGMSQIYMRGIGDYSANPLANPGVAFNSDGVYVGRPQAVNSNFYDVQRIEVLKGPQGTLYGRNSSGGDINLITNSPNFDGVNGTLNVESGNYDLFHIDGALNIPLSDTLSIRTAFNKISRDGYLTDGTDDDQEEGLRIKTLWHPNEDVSLLVNLDGEKVWGKGTGYVYLPTPPGASPWEAISSARSNAYFASFPGSEGVIPMGTDSNTNNKFWNASAQLDWNLGFATLTVIPAYRHGDTETLSYDAQRNLLTDEFDQETFEARLAHSTDAVKWVAGIYFFHEKDPGEIHIDVGPTVLYTKIPYNPSGTSWAAFSEATWSLTDRFRLITGGRGTTEKRQLNGVFYISPDGGASYIDHENFNGDVTFNSFTWKAGAEYDIAPENMAYFTASTGFKAGGLTQTTSPDNVYQPEKVLAYELGSRNRFYDEKLQVNLEAFYWKYKDQQQSHLTFDDTGSVNFLTQNAGDADIYGLDADIIARITRHDTLHVTGEYDHTHYSEFIFPVPAVLFNPASTGCRDIGTIPGPFLPLAQIDCSSFSLPHAPEWTGLIDYTHYIDLPSGATIALGTSARFSSWTWLAVDFSPEERAPSFHIFNADISYTSSSKNWSVTGYARNINNGTEYTGGVQSAQVPQLFTATINAPRTYGVQFHLNWH